LKSYEEKLDIGRKIQRSNLEVNPEGEMIDSDQKGIKQYSEVERDSSRPGDLVQYEAQYDPNNDYAIFGVGDPTRGGIQTMQEKMNIADKP
jgi:hypothetical protein